MILLSNVFFYWRSSGPNLLIGVIATVAVAVIGYLSCRRSPKGRWFGIIFFGAWLVYVPFVFIGSKIWPEEVSISAEEIHGRLNFKRFSFEVADIRAINTSSGGGKGGPGLHVFLKSKNTAVGIPIIWDQNMEAYKNALHKVCPDAVLDW